MAKCRSRIASVNHQPPLRLRALHAVAHALQVDDLQARAQRQFFLFAMLTVACTVSMVALVPVHARSQTGDPCRCILPEFVRIYATSTFPEWHILACKDLDDEMVRYLRTTKNGKRCITARCLDLNGDGSNDYVLLASKQGPAKPALRLIAVFVKAGHVINSTVLEEFNSDAVGQKFEVYLTVLPKGTAIKESEASGQATGSSVKGKGAVIVLHFFERSSKAFYWDGQSFCGVWTED